ncbi:MAG: M14 family zinc carboxypeptidase [Planctomycetota bacterium]
MSNRLSLALLAVAVAALPRVVAAPPPLPSCERIEQILTEVTGSSTHDVEHHRIGSSAGGRPLHAVSIVAKGQPATHEIVIVAGLEGRQPAGVLAALRALESLAHGVPAGIRVHFVPLANPDAYAAWAREPVVPTDGNAQPVDDDRDWRVDEDGPNDVDGDGRISSMRVIDPRGEWVADPAEPRLLRKADRKQGEVGRYRVLLEGTDDDGDAEINEDPVGGIEPARNFPHAYPEHSAPSGRYALEAPEARALAEFLLDHPNTALLVLLSSFDSVTQELASEDSAGRAGRRSRSAATLLNADDLPAFTTLAETFRAAFELERSNGKTNFPAGDLAGYAYFHLGIPVVSHPLWSVPRVQQSGESRPSDARPPSAESSAGDKEPPTPGRDSRRGRGRTDSPPVGGDLAGARAWLQFADEHPERAGFVPWHTVAHPSLGSVEVGGFVPGFREIPPAEEITRLGVGLVKFLSDAVGLLPRLEVDRIITESRPGDIHRVELRVRNTGRIPLRLAQGVVNRHVRASLVKPRLESGTLLLSGPTQGPVDALAPEGLQQFEWWVSAPTGKTITIDMDTPAGTSSRQITLGARREVF